MDNKETEQVNHQTRESIIVRTSALSIILNLLIAGIRIVTGLATASIAIFSEGVNNAMDAMTSVLTLVGTKLAGKHPDEKHPFGYGRIEYLTSLIISVMIFLVGLELLESSIKLVIKPQDLSISLLSLVVVAISAIIKFFLGVYTIRAGKKVDSKSLIAVGLEGRNDSFASVLTIASAVIFLVFHISIDGWIGIVMSGLILKVGIDVFRETISELIGRPGQKELANKLYKKIRQYPGVIGAADMMLHNYGPGAWSGSVNIEIDHGENIGDIYGNIHKLQLEIMEEYHVTMVFGIYAVDNDSEEGKALRKTMADFVRATDHVVSYHALYLDTSNHIFYCDLVVDYDLKDWEELRTKFTEMMREKRPEYQVHLTIETQFV